MLSLLLALSLPTLAADGQSGLLAPGAEPMQAGQASVGAGGAAGLLIFSGPAGLGLVEGSVALHDRVAMGGALLGGLAVDVGGGGLLWARGSLVEHDAFRLAPYAFGGAVTTEGLGGGVGLAMEGGFPRVRLDVSAPLVLVRHRPQVEQERTEVDWLPLYGEAGVSLLIGEERRHRLRAGVPMLTWRYQGETFYVEGGVTAALWVGGIVRGGARF